MAAAIRNLRESFLICGCIQFPGDLGSDRRIAEIRRIHQAVPMRSVFLKCPKCGAEPLEWPDSRHFRCDGCGLVFYRNITSAVAGFITDRQGRMLFIRRQREPARGMLAVPGGFIDAGERAEDALRREVLEEVGIRISEVRFLCSEPNVYRYKDVSYDVIDLFFTSEVDSFDGVQALDEVDGFLLVSPESVDPDDIAFPSIRKALAHFLARPS